MCWDLENVSLVTKSSLFEAANGAVLKSQVLPLSPAHPGGFVEPQTVPWRMWQPGLHRHSSGELSGTLQIQLMDLCCSEAASSSSSPSFSSSDNHHKMFGASKEGWVALPASLSSLLLLLLMECHSISDLDSAHCTANIALPCLEASFFPGANAPHCAGLAEAPGFCLSSSQAWFIPPSAAFQSVRGTIVPFFTVEATSKCLWWEQRKRQSHVAVLEQAGCNTNLWDGDEISGRMSHEVFLSWSRDRKNLVNLHWGKNWTEAAAQGKECNWEKTEESVLVSVLFYLLQQMYSVLFLIWKWGIFYIIYMYYIIPHSRMGNTQSLLTGSEESPVWMNKTGMWAWQRGSPRVDSWQCFVIL